MKSISLKVKGTVQGVGFRAFVNRTAKELNIKGIVKNEPDGSVYIEAIGKQEDLDEFIGKCKRGPAWASVSDINVAELDGVHYPDFSIQR